MVDEHPVRGGLGDCPGGSVQHHGCLVRRVREHEDLLESSFRAVAKQPLNELPTDAPPTRVLLHRNLVEKHLFSLRLQLPKLRPSEEADGLVALAGKEEYIPVVLEVGPDGRRVGRLIKEVRGTEDLAFLSPDETPNTHRGFHRLVVLGLSG